MMKRFLLCVLFFCSAIMAMAFNMTGKVVTQDHEALPYASVFLPDIQIGATTDLDGRYRLRDVPAGHHTMIVSYVGYATQTFEFTLEKDGARDFVLQEQAVTMNELFVTPTGESIERFILSQVVKHTKPLSKVASHFELNKFSRSEQRGNKMKTLVGPYLKFIDPAMGLMGIKTAFHYIIDHPDCRVEAEINSTFDNGSLKVQELAFGQCSPELNQDEQKSFRKISQRHSKDVGYDQAYDEMAQIKKDVEKMDKKTSGESAKALRYVGGYEEGGRSVHVLGYKSSEYHIVDGIWQIRRIVKTGKDGHVSKDMEFAELGKNVFMPISVFIEESFNFESLVEKEIDELQKENSKSYTSAKTIEKNNQRIKDLQSMLSSSSFSLKNSVAYTYKNFKLKR